MHTSYFPIISKLPYQCSNLPPASGRCVMAEKQCLSQLVAPWSPTQSSHHVPHCCRWCCRKVFVTQSVNDNRMTRPHKDLTMFLTAVDDAVEALDDLFKVHFVRPPRLTQDMLVFFHPGPQSCHLHAQTGCSTPSHHQVWDAHRALRVAGLEVRLKTGALSVMCLRRECGSNKNYILAKVYRNLANVWHQQQAGWYNFAEGKHLWISYRNASLLRLGIKRKREWVSVCVCV